MGLLQPSPFKLPANAAMPTEHALHHMGYDLLRIKERSFPYLGESLYSPVGLLPTVHSSHQPPSLPTHQPECAATSHGTNGFIVLYVPSVGGM